jgi:hypothetical protein
MIDWLLFILSLALVWPRGYCLAYIIDRSKSWSFGFKFFVGWIFGASAFTIDVFSTHALGGFALAPWIFLMSALGQIFGLQSVIFLFERKFLYPRFQNWPKQFNAWKNSQQKLRSGEIILILLILISCASLFVTSLWSLEWGNQYNVLISQAVEDKALFSAESGGEGIVQQPLNDVLLKIWTVVISGSNSQALINAVNIFYYVLLLLIFYNAFPVKVDRRARLAAVYAVSGLVLLYFVLAPMVSPADLLLSLFTFIAIVSLILFHYGVGKSFFFLSGMALAFGVWSHNYALLILFPIVLVFTLVFFLQRRVSVLDMFICWIFPVITVFPWLTFIFNNKINILTAFSPWQLIGVLPMAIFTLVFINFYPLNKKSSK